MRIELLGRIVAALIVLVCLIPAGCSSPTESDVVDMFTTPSPGELGLKVTVDVDEEAGTSSICFEFSIPQATTVYFEMCNATGYPIVGGSMYAEAGVHEVCWDGTNGDGKQIQSGLYVFHLIAGPYEDWQLCPICLTESDCEEMYGDVVY